MERRKYIILLIRTQETFHIYNVEPTNSMFQEIEASHCVTVMWLGHHITGNCSTPLKGATCPHWALEVTRGKQGGTQCIQMSSNWLYKKSAEWLHNGKMVVQSRSRGNDKGLTNLQHDWSSYQKWQLQQIYGAASQRPWRTASQTQEKPQTQSRSFRKFNREELHRQIEYQISSPHPKNGTRHINECRPSDPNVWKSDQSTSLSHHSSQEKELHFLGNIHEKCIRSGLRLSSNYLSNVEHF